MCYIKSSVPEIVSIFGSLYLLAGHVDVKFTIALVRYNPATNHSQFLLYENVKFIAKHSPKRLKIESSG